MPEYLAIAEVDQRQKFILRADKLREMLGGSRLIEDTVDMAQRAREPGVDLIWPVSGVIWYNSRDLAAVSRTLGRLRAELHQTGLSAAFAVEEYANGDFRKALDAAHAKIREVKTRRGGEDGSPHCPLFAQCGIQGRLYANRSGEMLDRRDRVSDQSWTRLKRSRGYEEKSIPEYYSTKPRPPEDLDDLVSSPSDSYIALCKGDIDGLGTRIQNIPWETLGVQNAFKVATSLNNALRSALKAAIAAATAIDNSRNAPILPLVAAGDDTWTVMKRHLAFDFISTLSDEFGEASGRGPLKDALGGSLTMSFGLLFAKKGFPFEAQLDLAEELEQNAKAFRRKSKKRSGADQPGWIDYYWLDSSGREPALEARRRGYRYIDDRWRFALTTRPWSIPEWKQMVQASRLLLGVPRRKRHQIDAILRYGHELSDLAWIRWRQSLGREECGALDNAIHAAPRELKPRDPSKSAWFEAPDRYGDQLETRRSVLPELAEIAGMLELPRAELAK